MRCSLILFDQSQIFFWAQRWTQDKRVQDKRVQDKRVQDKRVSHY